MGNFQEFSPPSINTVSHHTWLLITTSSTWRCSLYNRDATHLVVLLLRLAVFSQMSLGTCWLTLSISGHVMRLHTPTSFIAALQASLCRITTTPVQADVITL